MLGPRTTAIVALRIPGTDSQKTCFELALDSAPANAASWQLTRPNLTLAQESRYFAPANLRAAADDAAYMRLVTGYIARKYTLRYSGGLVPDVAHMLVKGEGVYLSPVTASSRAKLRRLYEVCPLAMVVECAGGKAADPADGKGVLEREVGDCGERGGLVCGSAVEVERAMEGLRT